MTVFKGGALSDHGKRTGLGGSFAGLAAYLERGPKASPNLERVEWVQYRNLDGIDRVRDAAEVMQCHAEESLRVEKPVYHFGLSLPAGEHLSEEQWGTAVDRVLDRMRLAGHQAVLIAHNDTPYEHVHVMVNRVGDDDRRAARVWDPYRDMVKAREAVRQIERDYGLHRTGPKVHRREVDPPPPSAGAHAESRRTGRSPLADRVREQAGDAFAQATSWRDLEQRLADRGFRLEPAERGSGVLVTDGTLRASLSHVDRSLSGPKLAQRFGETFRDYRGHTPEPPRVTPAAGRAVEDLPGETLRQRAAALVERVSSTRATFTESDLLRAAYYQAESIALVRETLRHYSVRLDRHVLKLGRDARGTVRYASREYVETEARMFAAAGRLASRADLRLDAARVERTLERYPHLSVEQRAAVQHATSGDDLAQVVGRAGAGKTTAARAIAAAYHDHGYEVHGAALAGKAAEGLQAEAGIPSRTLASLEHGWREGREALHGRAVLVVDEAGMIDARQLARVLEHAQEHGAKVVLLGDPAQLKAIGAGDAYRGLLEVHLSASLETIRRQAEPWQQEASADLARGRVRAALDAYDGAGRLHWSDTPAAARAELVAHYMADRTGLPASSQLIVAYRNADTALLNDAVREARQAAGDLRAPAVVVGGREYAAGDRLVFLRNDHTGREVSNLDRRAAAVGVKNGTLGTLEHAAADRFVVRLDDGRAVAFHPEQYRDIAHGYAITVHKSQGATVDRTYALADPVMDRHAAYVAMTRHREGFRLYADRESFPDRHDLDRALSRESRKDLARDYAAVELERGADRVHQWQERRQALLIERQSLLQARGTLEGAQDATRDLTETRAALLQATSRVYARPDEALRSLLADPQADTHLAAGQLQFYGQPHGRQRPLLGPDAQRLAALQAAPQLRGHLHRYHRVERMAADAVQAAERVGVTLAQVQVQLARVAKTLDLVEAALGPAEKSLLRIAERLGRTAVNTAVTLLPAAAQLPVRAALRAVERALDLARGLVEGIDLGR
jgi:Ti-type conjugative transfer relaxase TraA